MSGRDQSCESRVDEHLESRIEDLTLLFAGYTGQDCPRCEGSGELAEGQDPDLVLLCPICEGNGTLSEDIPDLGNLWEYGLSFDYVAPETFNNQPQGYFRYQLSWGGPSDEFRFYVNPDLSPYQVEYWFLDWYDGAKRILTGTDLDLLREIYQMFYDLGSCESKLAKSLEYLEV